MSSPVGTTAADAAPIRVLHVDDDPAFAETAAGFVQLADDRITVETADRARTGLARLADGGFDCVVSDYDMPGTNGIEFLEQVRADYPDLPFILFTGHGSEAVASDAISAGVTDYLQKEHGIDQYTILAHRIANAVTATRSTLDAERSRRRLDQILRTVPACVVYLDTAGRFVFANQRATAVLGLERAEVTERTYNSPEWDNRDLDGDPIPDEELPFRRVLDSGEPLYGFEHSIRSPDGTRKVLLINGVPLFDDTGAVEGVLFALTDVTERHELESELATRADQYRTLVEHFPGGGVFLYNEAFECVRAGGAGLSDVGLSPADVEGDRPRDRYPASIADEIEAHLGDAFEGRESDFEQSYMGRQYRVRTLPVRDVDGGIEQVMAVSQDVTEQRRRERELSRQNERLDDFADVVSHDLKGPLGVVAGRLELAQNDCDSEHLDHAMSALDRSRLLIDDLLALARERDGVSEVEPVDLATLARSCWGHVETDGATLVVETTRPVHADPTRLRQLLENLFRNAIEHGSTDSQPRAGGAVEPAGGAVTVTLGDLEEGFYVEDDGPGIPAAERERVFERGYSRKADGTGFGLSIVRDVVASHGWQVAVTDGAAGGARFEFSDVTVV
jgi:PAS domain S-box-containing protein